MFLEISHGGGYEYDMSSGLLRPIVLQKFIDVSEVLTASIIRMMMALMLEVVSTSETQYNLLGHTAASSGCR
jgi:hypothetical protein